MIFISQLTACGIHETDAIQPATELSRIFIDNLLKISYFPLNEK